MSSHVRLRPLLGTLALTTCLTRQAIVVAPPPAVRADSLARAVFARSALNALERVAKEDSLEQWSMNDVNRECFSKRNFHVCGHMQDSVVLIEFAQGGMTNFTDRNERIRRDVLERLRDEFGERRVRECSSHGSVCPRLVQIDSGR